MKTGMFQKLDDVAFMNTLSVRSLSTRNACITEITVVVQGQLVTAQGTSRRNPEDKHIAAYGQLLSYSRACQSLAAKLERRGDGLLAHKEWIAETRPKQLERSAEWHARRAKRIAKQRKMTEKSSKAHPVDEVTLQPSSAAGKTKSTKPVKAGKKTKAAKKAQKKVSK